MRAFAERIGSTSGLMLLLLAGCNSVLGIEEASLDPGSAPSGSTQKPQVKPTLACDEPTDKCKECRNACPLDTCLGDNGCRNGLFDYRSCLGSDCQDDEAPQCLEAFAVAASSTSTFPNCVANCAEDCADSPLASTCELYCACMSDNCPEEYEKSLQSCLETCSDEDLTLIGCRLVHCQYAPKYGVSHCDHAMGRITCLSNAPPPQFDCDDKRISTWTCESNDECCSDSCEGNFCK